MRIPSSLAIVFLLAGCSSQLGRAQLPAYSLANGPAPSTVAWNYVTLHSFTLGGDGIWPTSGLASLGGVLYGTTYGGGGTSHGRCKNGCGTVYSITTSGGEHVVYAFKGGRDGAIPQAALTANNGVLYGTTSYGGQARRECPFGRGCGTVFEITRSGSESVIYEFKGGADGSNPQGELLEYNGQFYGTTTGGLIGRTCPGHGTVYKLSATSSGWHETVLHRFRGGSRDGACPIGNLVALNGELYGVTSAGGGSNVGTVYRVAPDGSDEKVLWSSNPSVGDYPVGIVTSGNMVYGTASAGGKYKRGIIFSLAPNGDFTTIHQFAGHHGDGASPFAAPIAYEGKLYGTTEGGGANGVGTIYRTAVTKPYRKTLLYSFARTPDGHQPVAPLLQSAGAFYGTTVLGGNYASLNGIGTVFRISP